MVVCNADNVFRKPANRSDAFVLLLLLLLLLQLLFIACGIDEESVDDGVDELKSSNTSNESGAAPLRRRGLGC
jgi:hypothetical protein